MIWVKAFHITFMVAWFAGIFYLPRLFVNHVMAEEEASLHVRLLRFGDGVFSNFLQVAECHAGPRAGDDRVGDRGHHA